MPNQHRHRKRFGQNFLQDKNLLNKIARSIHPTPQDHIIEIGPGQGALTQYIIDNVASLDVIEIDRDLVAYLKQHFSQKHLTIHEADVLAFDFSTLLKKNHPVRIIGNLPYNISTPIIFKLLQHTQHIKDMTFLLQREMVLRMAASPGNKQYGRLSVMTQYYCQTQRMIDVPATAFFPPPKVESCTVQLTPYSTLPHQANDMNHFENIVRAAFSSRRKTIHNGLKKIIDTHQLPQINIPMSSRAEELTVAQFVQISNEIPMLE